MPPNPKYTKEEIVTAAFELVREAGSDGERIAKEHPDLSEKR